MASQIYSRYIPPAKKSAPVPKDSPTPVLNITEPSLPTPPATRHDASSTYARYVPPAKSQYQRSSADVSSQSASKRKREDLVEPSSAVKKSKKGMKLSPPPPIAKTSTAQSRADRKKKESSKKLKTKTIPATAEDRDGEAVDMKRGDESTEALLKSMTGSKKERKTTAAQTGSFEETSPETIPHDESASREPKSKKKKHRLAGEDVRDASEIMTEKAEEDTKHNKLMEKRQKSLKKAAKLAEKAVDDGPAEDEVMLDAPVEIHDLCPLPQPEPVPELPQLPASASLPTWLAFPIRVTPTTTAAFEDLGLPDDVTMVFREKGYKEAFAVQAAVLPLLLPRDGYIPSGDVLVSAATGSGKTLSYVLPVIEDICRSHSRGIRGLIVMPTRELVSQVRQVSEACASAFSRSNGYKNRAKIGTAVGNETIEAERNHLMTENILVDVERYEIGVAKLRAPWRSEGLEREEEIFSYEGVQPALRGDVMGPRPRVDVLICTPGRLVEHIRKTPGFSLANLKWLVVDEADKLLDQSFQQWLPTVMAKLPSKLGQVRKVILSATMTTDVGQLNQLRLMRPKMILLEGSSHTIEDLTTQSGDLVVPALLAESSVKVEDENIKPLYLMELLKREKMIPDADSRSDDPSSDSDSGPDSSVFDGERPDSTSSASPVSETVNKQLLQALSSTTRGVLIFTKSNETAARLGRLIALLSPALSSAIGTLTSTTPRAARQRTIASFASCKISVLVASDLVSRGLDLPNLAHVINYDVPNSIQSYIHRIGRTARAGKEGHAWTLYTRAEGRWFVNEIGRSETIKRANGSNMRRINIREDALADQRAKYEEALEILGKEANTSSARTS